MNGGSEIVTWEQTNDNNKDISNEVHRNNGDQLIYSARMLPPPFTHSYGVIQQKQHQKQTKKSNHNRQ